MNHQQTQQRHATALADLPSWGKHRHRNDDTRRYVFFAVPGPAPVLIQVQPIGLFALVLEHSHQPAEQRAISGGWSPRPRLELVARYGRPDWQVWGNDVDSDIAMLAASGKASRP